ncbi:hypothetical protein ACET3Z_027267 [Daucus carota]
MRISSSAESKRGLIILRLLNVMDSINLQSGQKLGVDELISHSFGSSRIPPAPYFLNHYIKAKFIKTKNHQRIHTKVMVILSLQGNFS